jgi:DNA mismatch repair protein MutS
MNAEILEKLPNSPMWVQYRGVKKDALDALLFYRMGDFYELFLDDAVEAAGILGITLTARNKNEGMPIPMCGVPYHSAQSYINRLLKAGKRVAICEQTEAAGATKGIVKREIVRIVSPGMAFDPDTLDSEKNHYLLALDPNLEEDNGSYCLVDLSTGSLEYASYSSLDQLRDDLSLLHPSELLLSAKHCDSNPWNRLIQAVGKEYFPCITQVPDFYFAQERSAQELCRHFDVLNLEGFGLGAQSPELGSVGAAFRRIRDTQKLGDLSHLLPPKPRSRQGFVQMDESTMEHLDLFPKPGQNPEDSCFHHLNKTSTAMGARRLRELLARPLYDRSQILARQGAIKDLLEKDSLNRRVRESLSGIRDLERLLGKVGLESAGPRDLQALQLILARLPDLKASLQELAEAPLLREIEASINPFPALHDYLAVRLKEELPAVAREGNIFRSGWNQDLDELISLTENARATLQTMEEREKAATGISSLKIKYNKVFGYFIEVTNSNLASVPSHYVRKQTTANSERFLTDELKKFEEKALTAEEKRIALEGELFRQALKRVSEDSRALLATAAELALLDALTALASAARDYGYTQPEISEDSTLEIQEGRHPALEHLVGRDKFIPNSVSFSQKESTFLITGPNMAGKSTYMRQVALITLLAHTGSFVPAKSAQIGLVDRIATRVGASDRIGRGQSTFMVEMNEMARILRQSSSASLLIIDEIGRGTSTYDGLALAWAILEDIAERLRCRTLFATHYHELPALEGRHSSIRNLSVVVEEKDGEIVFLHEVRRGKAPGSYGVHVARLAGLPAPVVNRAAAILETLEKGAGKLQKAQKDALNQNLQMDFFSAAPRPKEPPEHLTKLEAALRSLDLERTSPLEALLAIKGWKDGLPPTGPAC